VSLNINEWCFVPDWPAPLGVGSLFTMRGIAPGDGASGPPWAYFNLGTHVGDDAQAVQLNRNRLAAQIGARPVYLDQVHGVHSVTLTSTCIDNQQADGAFTVMRGVVCTILVADCLPVLLTDASGSQVAAVHCGWRGLAAGALEQVMAKFSCSRAQILAWLGPCIGPQRFEVGAEVRAAFMAHDAGASECFVPVSNGKFFANLPALARRRLDLAGVSRVFGNDGNAQWCTVQNPQRYFSYRRDLTTGRMAACIWRSL
jgi:YfiH family protein